MSWEHSHFDRAFAAFLTAGADELPDPDAVFFTEAEANEYIARERQKAMLDDYGGDESKARAEGRTPEDHLHEAGFQEVRNLFIPWWNSTDEPNERPEPIPEHAGTVVGPDRQFLATWLYRVSMVCACLRNHARSGAKVDLDVAVLMAQEVSVGLEEFNQFFREIP
ncbi:hypothetical protein [Gemmata sp.]|uniref:hypothetical protein n=1 Tax=Gemmata sp. TaxID=1914242 RepID=UPI003F71EFE6